MRVAAGCLTLSFCRKMLGVIGNQDFARIVYLDLPLWKFLLDFEAGP
jgi:hypothetical protein